MTVCVCSTTRGYKGTGPGETGPLILSWLSWAERWHEAGHRFFLSVQRDGPHNADMDTLTDIVRSVDGTVWDFSIDEGVDTIDNSSRLGGICMGRNLAHEFAQRDASIEWILFLDTDVAPPVDCIERLLEVAAAYPAHALIGGHIPTYGLGGPIVETAPAHWDLQAHWTSAGCLMVRRDAFRRLRWRWDLEGGATDDPAFQADARALGFGETLVRHNVIALHQPGTIGPFQTRGHVLTLTKEL